MKEFNEQLSELEFDEEWQGIMNQVRQLPDELLPSTMLEERTVRELRRRGLLRHARSFTPGWMVGSVAAALALFATGVIVGQYLGTRTTAGVVAQIQNQNSAATAAAQVQQTGTAYVKALEALVSETRQAPTSNGQVNPQAREVALTALYEAANEVVRLAPNDPVVAKILVGIEQEKKQTQANNGRSAIRQIVWF